MAKYSHKTSQRRKSAPDLSGISAMALTAVREKLLIRRVFLSRNVQAADKLSAEIRNSITKCEQELAVLRSRTPITGALGGGYTLEAKAVHDDIELQIARLREKRDGKPYRLEGIEYPSLRRMVEKLVIQLQNVEGDIQSVDHRIVQVSGSLQRAEQAAEKERRKDENERKKAQAAERKRAKTEQRDAMAKAYSDKTREQADIVRRRLPRDHPCPYCFCELDARAHADHIHPVSKGGLSTVRNMVYACGECNQLKADLTLFRFIGKFKRNADQIFRNLHALGKDF